MPGRLVAVTENSVKIRRLDKDLPLPVRAHRGDAGADLFATTDVVLAPGERALVGTGIALALPLGTVGLVHPRSGLAAREGLSIVNAPGTVDSGYRARLEGFMEKQVLEGRQVFVVCPRVEEDDEPVPGLMSAQEETERLRQRFPISFHRPVHFSARCHSS